MASKADARSTQITRQPVRLAAGAVAAATHGPFADVTKVARIQKEASFMAAIAASDDDGLLAIAEDLDPLALSSVPNKSTGEENTPLVVAAAPPAAAEAPCPATYALHEAPAPVAAPPAAAPRSGAAAAPPAAAPAVPDVAAAPPADDEALRADDEALEAALPAILRDDGSLEPPDDASLDSQPWMAMMSQISLDVTGESTAALEASLPEELGGLCAAVRDEPAAWRDALEGGQAPQLFFDEFGDLRPSQFAKLLVLRAFRPDLVQKGAELVAASVLAEDGEPARLSAPGAWPPEDPPSLLRAPWVADRQAGTAASAAVALGAACLLAAPLEPVLVTVAADAEDDVFSLFPVVAGRDVHGGEEQGRLQGVGAAAHRRAQLDACDIQRRDREVRKEERRGSARRGQGKREAAEAAEAQHEGKKDDSSPAPDHRADRGRRAPDWSGRGAAVSRPRSPARDLARRCGARVAFEPPGRQGARRRVMGRRRLPVSARLYARLSDEHQRLYYAQVLPRAREDAARLRALGVVGRTTPGSAWCHWATFSVRPQPGASCMAGDGTPEGRAAVDRRLNAMAWSLGVGLRLPQTPQARLAEPGFRSTPSLLTTSPNGLHLAIAGVWGRSPDARTQKGWDGVRDWIHNLPEGEDAELVGVSPHVAASARDRALEAVRPSSARDARHWRGWDAVRTREMACFAKLAEAMADALDAARTDASKIRDKRTPSARRSGAWAGDVPAAWAELTGLVAPPAGARDALRLRRARAPRRGEAAAARAWLGPGQHKRATFPTSKAPISATFHSFRLILGRAIISRNGLEAWMFSS
ncbi:hypothetical protein JL720_17069 [Aureococcus anophagefferens]|nr:hypothetical protein JL720_17069 [Aureococcus anophagefferens]